MVRSWPEACESDPCATPMHVGTQASNPAVSIVSNRALRRLGAGPLSNGNHDFTIMKTVPGTSSATPPVLGSSQMSNVTVSPMKRFIHGPATLVITPTRSNSMRGAGQRLLKGNRRTQCQNAYSFASSKEWVDQVQDYWSFPIRP